MAKTIDVTVRRSRDVLVIYVEGYLNSLLGERLEEFVQEKIEEGHLKFILNFGQVRLINSVGISILIGLVESVYESGGEVSFAEVRKTHRDVFAITGLSSRVKIFESEEDALQVMSAVA